MENYKILKILKGKDDYLDFSIIGLVEDKKTHKKLILKVGKYPGWEVVWEYRVAYSIQQYLPFVEQFSKILECKTMNFQVDHNDKIIKTLVDTKNKYGTRQCWVTLSEYVIGPSFIEKLEIKSYNKLFAGIFQILIALFCSQKLLKMTHYDLHPNNILTEEVNPNILYLFDVVEDSPVMVWSGGYKLKIIDYEYSHINGMAGSAFDSKIDLCVKGYNPGKPDPGYDCLRFVISTLTYYSNKHSDSNITKIRNHIIETFNKNCKEKSHKIDERGVISDLEDPIKNDVLNNSKFLKCLNQEQFDFLNRNYYQIVHLLTHNMKCPISLKNENLKSIPYSVHLEKFLEFLKVLFTPVLKSPSQILRVLYYVSELLNDVHFSGLTDQDIIKTRILKISNYVFQLKPKGNAFVREDLVYIWVGFLFQSFEDCIPHFEYLLNEYFVNITEKRVNEQNAQEFTPMKMFNWFNTNYFNQNAQEFLPETEIHWMRDNSLEIFTLENLFQNIENPQSYYEYLNYEIKNKNIADKSILLKELFYDLYILKTPKKVY